MSLGSLLSKLLGSAGSNVEFREYECDECGNTFQSAKRPERVQCPDCLSNDLTEEGTVGRS